MANDLGLAFPCEVGIRVNEDQRELLKAEALERGMSVAAVVRLALERQFFIPRRASMVSTTDSDKSAASS